MFQNATAGSQQLPSHREIDAAFASLSDEIPAAAAAAAPAGKPLNLNQALKAAMRYYDAARPFLVVASQNPFFPSGWRKGIAGFITTLDTVRALVGLPAQA